MDSDEDYEFVDLMHTFDLKNVWALSKHNIYIPRDVYDQNVVKGQECRDRVLKQLKIDFYRSRFYKHRKRMPSPPYYLPTETLRYCTQAVMALPIELISEQNSMVAEQIEPKALCVYIDKKKVKVTKPLRFLCGNNWYDFKLSISLSENDVSHVLVSFELQ
jgi:hypothetical protein